MDEDALAPVARSFEEAGHSGFRHVETEAGLVIECTGRLSRSPIKITLRCGADLMAALEKVDRIDRSTWRRLERDGYGVRG